MPRPGMVVGLTALSMEEFTLLNMRCACPRFPRSNASPHSNCLAPPALTKPMTTSMPPVLPDGRTPDWIHPARVPGPRHCAQPTSPPPESGSLFRLLSPRPSSQGTGSGLARLAPGRTTRPRQHHRIAGVWRTASPLHPPSCVKVLLPLKVVRRDLRSNAYSAPG